MMRRTALLGALVLLGALAACGEHPGGECANCLLPPHMLNSEHALSDTPAHNAPAPAAHAMCVGTPAPCAHYASAPQQCASVQGCMATYSSCLPKSCSKLTDAASCNRNRCSWRFLCGGTAAACYHAPRELCEHQAGCAWLADSHICSGVARSCSALKDPISCGAQSGCGVLRGCVESLAAPACLHNTTEAKCAANNACSWQPDGCGGVPAACGVNASQATCEQVSGCAWIQMQGG